MVRFSGVEVKKSYEIINKQNIFGKGDKFKSMHIIIKSCVFLMFIDGSQKYILDEKSSARL